MSLNYPSIPLNAQDAKLIADQALLKAKAVATSAWLNAASVSLTTAAHAGLYSLDLAYDPTVVNISEIIAQLATVLGYTTTNNTTSHIVNADWQSAARLKVTPDSNPQSNFGYQQPNAN